MKNTIIVVLIVIVGILGYLQVSKDDLGPSEKTISPTDTNQPTVSSNKIDLSNKGLSEVPKNILDDGSVTTFDVSGNQLTGALPAEIRKLTNLEVLIAANNKLTGIPAEIGQLKKLKTANFANNNITGLPLEIGNLSNLETLDLRGNPDISRHDISLIQAKIPRTKILTD